MIRVKPLETTSSRTLMSLLCLVTLLAGIAGLVWATRLGPGLSPDSVHYIAVAQSLSNGHGLADSITGAGEPLTRFPPIYPLMLAAGSFLQLSAQQAAVWLSGGLMVGLVLVMLVLLALSGSSRPWAAAFLTLSMVASPVMFIPFTMVWTEPLFIFLCYACLFCTIVFLSGDAGWPWFLAIAVTAALAPLTRYIGVILAPTVGIGLVVFGKGSTRRRLLLAGALTVTSETPLAAWWIRNQAVAGSATSRVLAVHPVGLEQVKQAIGTLSGWIHLPIGLPGELKLAVLLGLAGITLMVIGPRGLRLGSAADGASVQDRSLPSVINLMALFIVMYALGLGLSMSFVDANTPLDDRLLSPIFPAVALIAGCAIGSVPRRGAVTFLARGLLSLVLIMAVGLMLKDSFGWAQRSASTGIGFNQLRWRSSDVLRAMPDLSPSVGIYSNSPEAVYLYAHRSAMPLPSRFNQTTQQPNLDYRLQMERLRKRLEMGEEVVVYFSGLPSGFRPDLQELVDWAGEDMEISFEDGAVIGSPEVLSRRRLSWSGGH